MSAGRSRVLVVDDDEDTAFLLHRVLYQDNDHFDVLLARSVETALAILSDVPVEVIVTDVQLPDRSGMDLLSWAAIERPDTRVILMTGFETDALKERAHACGCLRLIRKPFAMAEMRDAVLQALDRRDGFAGTLSELSCVDVVQMLCLARKTTAVRFSEEAGSGAVYIEQGEVVHAVWQDLTGEDAFYGMMGVHRGAFHTTPFPVDVERSITAKWQYLVMEGTRRLDEAARDRPPGTEPPAPPAAPERRSRPALGSSPGGKWPMAAPQGPRLEVPRLIDEGFAYLRTGKRDEARRSWEEALRLDPKNRAVELNLRKLNGTPAPPRTAPPRDER